LLRKAGDEEIAAADRFLDSDLPAGAGLNALSVNPDLDALAF
jgi:hypothetical protein